MRAVLWASVRVYARRYVATVVAIVVGVGFVVATNVVTGATRDGLLAGAAAQYTGAGVVVTNLSDPEQADRVLRQLPGAASVNATSYAPLASGGQTFTEDGDVSTVSTLPALRWQRLTSGRFPTRAGQGLLDAEAARQHDLAVGDRVTVGAGAAARTVTVTGLVRSSVGALSAPVYLTWPDLRSLGGGAFVSNVVVAGSDPSAVRASVSGRLVVDSRADYLQAQQKELTRGVDVISAVLLVFATIAFFVAALVIANTFAILLAQRARDFALLRCVGATRRQVRRSVLVEALLVGLGSATAGIAVGAGLGVVLVAAGRHFAPRVPFGGFSLTVSWVLGAWVLGVLVTVGASLLPALRGTRVSPLAALRPVASLEVRTAAGAVRIVSAVLLELAGVALLALAVVSHMVIVMLLGGMLSAVGVLMGGPVLVPACVRLLGLLASRFGVPGRLAVSNALRDPRRTAATTASLLVGVTLISAMVVGMATVRESVNRDLDQEHPLDLALTSPRVPLDGGTLGRVEALRGVGSAASLDGADVRVRQGKHTSKVLVLGVDARARATLRSSAELGRLVPGTVYLPWNLLNGAGLTPDRRAQVTLGGRTSTVRLQGVLGVSSAVASPDTLQKIAAGPAPARAVWVRATARADAAELSGRLTSVGSVVQGRVDGGLQSRSFVNLQLDVMTGAVVGLLGIGVAIALVGVGSTLGLSVLERVREHAVLRALGLTRRQLRGTLAVEALLLTGVAALLGVAIGSAYAWVGVKTVAGEALNDISVHWPVGQLLLVVLAAAAAGLLACGVPARRAARVTPAAGLTAD